MILGATRGIVNAHETPPSSTKDAMADSTLDRLADRQAIADLMTGWIHRDLQQWDELRALFTPEATIEITWFRGLARDFVDGSQRMGAGRLRTKHVVTNPVITFSPTRPDRAFVETNAMIVGEIADLGLGTSTHNRFLDRVVRTDAGWRIAHRDSSYDLGAFTYPWGVQAAAPLDEAALRRHPVEYASLAYLLEQAGFPVEGTFPTRGSELEREIKAAGHAWLTDEAPA